MTDDLNEIRTELLSEFESMIDKGVLQSFGFSNKSQPHMKNFEHMLDSGLTMAVYQQLTDLLANPTISFIGTNDYDEYMRQLNMDTYISINLETNMMTAIDPEKLTEYTKHKEAPIIKIRIPTTKLIGDEIRIAYTLYERGRLSVMLLAMELVRDARMLTEKLNNKTLVSLLGYNPQYDEIDLVVKTITQNKDDEGTRLKYISLNTEEKREHLMTLHEKILDDYINKSKEALDLYKQREEK